MSETLNSVPLSGGIGAEILDLDLAEPLDSDQRDALGKLFVEHGLLVLRRQALSQDQQVRVMSYFGPTVDPSTETGYICLLYTSPSPRDRTRSRMPSSA